MVNALSQGTFGRQVRWKTLSITHLTLNSHLMFTPICFCLKRLKYKLNIVFTLIPHCMSIAYSHGFELTTCFIQKSRNNALLLFGVSETPTWLNAMLHVVVCG